MAKDRFSERHVNRSGPFPIIRAPRRCGALVCPRRARGATCTDRRSGSAGILWAFQPARLQQTAVTWWFQVNRLDKSCTALEELLRATARRNQETEEANQRLLEQLMKSFS